MICPLLRLGVVISPRQVEEKDQECLKQGCAWWDTEEQSCDPTGLRHWVKSLIAQVWAIKEKMPHGEE